MMTDATSEFEDGLNVLIFLFSLSLEFPRMFLVE